MSYGYQKEEHRFAVLFFLQRAVKTDISVRNKKAVRRAAHQLRAQQSGSQLERRRKEAGG